MAQVKIDGDEIIIETYNLYREVGKQVISGEYERKDTCLFPLARESNVSKGRMTAEEVAEFINKKMQGERFGFVFVKDDGDKITWYDEQPFNVQIVFSKIPDTDCDGCPYYEDCPYNHIPQSHCEGLLK